jgi:hypothetical protein
MSRLSVVTGPSSYPTPAVQVNRYRDAARVLVACGEGVPKRSEFCHGWGVMLPGTIAIAGAAEALNNMKGPIQGSRGSRLANAILAAVPESQPIAQSFAESRALIADFKAQYPPN